MRDKNLSLKLFKNIAILNQFLYEEGHSIEYNNGITTLKITMDENFEYRVFNPNFPETKPTIFLHFQNILFRCILLIDDKDFY